MIREMQKLLTLIDLYGRQTTEDNRRKRAPRHNGNFHVPRLFNIEVVIILTTSSLIDTIVVISATPSCICRVIYHQ